MLPLGFKISLVSGQPSFDSLPVAKITNYPLEERDYKPFAQSRICINEDYLYIQMWAFEVNPSPKSSLKAILTSPDGESGFSVELLSTGHLEFTPFPDNAGFALPLLHSMWGEDLQGEYWGGSLQIPIETAYTLLKKQNLQPGGIIRGNLYKISTDSNKPHKGSYFPADFAHGREFAQESMDNFEVVGY